VDVTLHSEHLMVDTVLDPICIHQDHIIITELFQLEYMYPILGRVVGNRLTFNIFLY
jgi:hypothetical protein